MNFNDYIYLMDLVGTLGFSIYGAKKAIEVDYDFLGVFICAFLTGCGGGTIRDFLLGSIIPSYLFNFHYFLVVLLGVIVTYSFFRIFKKINKFVLFCDSVGLIVFAFIGIKLALENELSFFGVISFALISSCFGGVLRDLVLNEKPELMYKDFYGTVAILMGVIFSLFPALINSSIGVLGIMLGFLLLRYLVIWQKLSLKDCELFIADKLRILFKQ